ncbi:MAG TPA: hypothetical protein DCP92_21025 [Nitrospiraceae bacterium]|nr:hypothetical protein [Nitrospiraceae bacterium]
MFITACTAQNQALGKVKGFNQYLRVPYSPQKNNQAASLMFLDLLKSSLFIRNFVKIAFWDEPERNSGKLFRRAIEVTNSEGGIPGRIVRIQELK